jgi:hypothetical protein
MLQQFKTPPPPQTPKKEIMQKENASGFDKKLLKLLLNEAYQPTFITPPPLPRRARIVCCSKQDSEAPMREDFWERISFFLSFFQNMKLPTTVLG